VVKDKIETLPIFTKSNKLNAHINKQSWWKRRGLLDCYYELSDLDKEQPITKICKVILLQGDYTFPKCIECGTELTLNNSGKFPEFCSTKCSRNNQEVYEKYKKTNLEKHGIENPFKSAQLRTKESYIKSIQAGKKTLLRKYGVTHNSQINSISSTNLDDTSNKTISEISKEIGFSYSATANHLRKHELKYKKQSTSKEEQIIQDWLVKNNISFIRNTKKVIPPFELDFYLPDYNLAIEVNGIYWHCEQQGKDKWYHLNKTTACSDIGIKLIHIYDNQINNNLELILSRLETQFSISQRIFARKCKVTTVSKAEAKEFLSKNHIQGYVGSTYQYGLRYEGELISIMTFGLTRMSKKYDYELLRFCNKIGYSVVGGASRLLNLFEKKFPNCSIISYADRNWSTGNLYEKLGFQLSHISPPNYKYTNNYRRLESRNKYMKHKLSGVLEHFNSDKTEYQNMLENGYDRIWDCGNLVYIKNGS
jgi:very-short-patch-repair endonuclease